MSIRQFNAAYVPGEDRILMRVTLEDENEYRFWLTRASLRGFFRQVDGWLAYDTPSATAALTIYQRQAGAVTADLPTPMHAAGEAPLLVETIDVVIKGESAHVAMALDGDRQADFDISGDVLFGMHHLLTQAAQMADWGLNGVAPLQTAQRLH